MRDGEECVNVCVCWCVEVCVCARVSDRRGGGGGLAAVEREREGGRSEPSHWLVCAGRGERERVCVSGSVNECSVMMETLRVPPNLENVTKIKMPSKQAIGLLLCGVK